MATSSSDVMYCHRQATCRGPCSVAPRRHDAGFTDVPVVLLVVLMAFVIAIPAATTCTCNTQANIAVLDQLNNATGNRLVRSGTICDWAGATCSRQSTSEVASLVLRAKNLTGDVKNADVSQLSSLDTLDVSSNALLRGSLTQMPLPSSLRTLIISSTSITGALAANIPSSLPKLQKLDATSCSLLTGTLSSNWGNSPIASTLTTLSLSRTDISGTVPDSWTRMSALFAVDLSETSVGGTLPSFSAASSLNSLLLAGCKFTGTLPLSYLDGTLRNLDVLNVSRNGLTGSLPSTMGDNLRTVDVSYNGLSGSLPGSIFGQFLTTFDASHNSLSGTLPAVLGQSLAHLPLDDNALSGTLPSNWTSNVLTTLSLSDNGFSATLPTDWAANLPALSSLSIRNNSLTGRIPAAWNQQMNRLTSLDLSCNRLVMPVGSVAANPIQQLQFVNLSHNNLIGNLSAVIGYASLLQLDVSHNSIVDVTTGLARMIVLEDFRASSNRITSLPSTLPSTLQRLVLSNNGVALGATLPVTWVTGGSLARLEVLDVRNNSGISGSLPNEWGLSLRLASVDVSLTNITGKYPDLWCPTLRPNFAVPLALTVDGNRLLLPDGTEISNATAATAAKWRDSWCVSRTASDVSSRSESVSVSVSDQPSSKTNSISSSTSLSLPTHTAPWRSRTETGSSSGPSKTRVVSQSDVSSSLRSNYLSSVSATAFNASLTVRYVHHSATRSPLSWSSSATAHHSISASYFAASRTASSSVSMTRKATSRSASFSFISLRLSDSVTKSRLLSSVSWTRTHNTEVLSGSQTISGTESLYCKDSVGVSLTTPSLLPGLYEVFTSGGVRLAVVVTAVAHHVLLTVISSSWGSATIRLDRPLPTAANEADNTSTAALNLSATTYGNQTSNESWWLLLTPPPNLVEFSKYINVSILLLASWTESDGALPCASTSRVSMEIPGSPPPTSAALRAAGDVAAVTLSAPLAVSGAAAGGLVQQSLLQLSLSTCQFSHTQRLSLMASPTQLSFGPDDGGPLRGATVGNCVLLAAVVAVGLLLGLMHHFWCNTITLRHSLSQLLLPGRYFLFIGLLLQPTVSCAVSLLWYRYDGISDVALGVAAIAAICGSSAFFVHRVVQLSSRLTPRPLSPRDLLDRIAGRKICYVPEGVDDVGALADCADDDGTSVAWMLQARRYDSLLCRRHGKREWFLSVEVASTVVYGVLGGFRPTTAAGCHNVRVAFLVHASVFFTTVVVVRPYVSILDSVFHTGIAALSAATGALLLTGKFVVADVLSYLQMVSVWVVCLLHLCNASRRLYGRWKAKWQLSRQRSTEAATRATNTKSFPFAVAGSGDDEGGVPKTLEFFLLRETSVNSHDEIHGGEVELQGLRGSDLAEPHDVVPRMVEPQAPTSRCEQRRRLIQLVCEACAVEPAYFMLQKEATL